jgi:hypothetical protein
MDHNDEVPSFMKAGTGNDARFLNDPSPMQRERTFTMPVRDFTPDINPPAARPAWLRDPEWPLPGIAPREVQIEALRRSTGGFALFDGADGVERWRPMNSTGIMGPGFNYFMEMRLGKTYTALADFAIKRRLNEVKWFVAFSPNSFKDGWAKEIAASGLDLAVHVFESGKVKLAEDFIRAHPEGGAIIVNYEAVLSEATWEMLNRLYAGGKVFVAQDESVKVKNAAGKTFKAIWALSKRAARVVNLSGKPVVQGPHDLYGQLKTAKQINAWTFPSFRTNFCNMGGFQGKQVIGPRNVPELQAILRPNSFIARTTDWYDAEGVDYADPIRIDLLPEQKRLMKQMEADFMVAIGETPITGEQIISRNLKMQQIRSGFIYDNEGKMHVVVPPDKNPLFLDILRFMEEDTNYKVVIVAYYKPTLDALEAMLAKYQPAVIRGAQWHKDTGRSVPDEKDRFNNDPRCRVLIGQETSLKYAHTLMGTALDPSLVMIFAENSYSLDDRAQVEKRQQGVMQLGPIQMYDYWASALDRRTVLALQRKEDISAVTLNYARELGILPYAK